MNTPIGTDTPNNTPFDVRHNLFDANGTVLSELFVDASKGDYRLKPTATRAINQGMDVAPYAGNNYNEPVVGIPDIGAYEWGLSIPLTTIDRTDPVGSGTISARGQLYTHEGWKMAFDNNPNTKWLDSSGQSWIQFRFGGSAKYAVSKYTITSANDVPARDPKDWRLYGTNVTNPGPGDFTLVDSRSGVIFSDRYQKLEFSIANTTEYRTYRLEITSNYGNINRIQLAEIELFAPSSRGTVELEKWENISGTLISAIAFNNTPPTSKSTLTSLQSTAKGDKYGVRIRGYIVPTTTADYTFFIASDDNGEFWLSTDDQPSNKGTSAWASVLGWTYPREWTKYVSQRSAPRRLQAGKRYYFEALMKEETFGDNLAIGWTTTPDIIESISVIGGQHIAPYQPCLTCRSSVEAESSVSEEDFTLKLHPNPAHSEVRIDLSGFAGESAVEVQIRDMTGKLLLGKQVQVSAEVKQVTLPVSQLPQGLFLVRVQGSKRAKTAKLVITQ